MRVNVFIVGTFLLLGNITLNAQLLIHESVTVTEESSRSTHLRDDLKRALMERGFDSDAASAAVEHSIEDDDALVLLKMQNYLNVMEGIDYEMLINEIIIELLFGNVVDLSSYDTLVALTQRLQGANLDTQCLNRLSAVARSNQYLKMT